MTNEKSAPYGLIWLALVGLLGLSLLFGLLRSPGWMNGLVFGVAAVKAFLVLRYFMGLAAEPRWVSLFLAGALACVAVLFALLVPDVVWRNGWIRP